MPSTSTDHTLHTATRLRSSGATRDQVIDQLMGSGMRLGEANERIDAIDTKLGMDGRTLPDDVSPAIHKQIDDHRAAQKAARPAAGPRFESAARNREQMAERATNVVPTLAELSAGQSSSRGPKYVTPTANSTSAPSESADAATGPVELTSVQNRALRSQAVTRARTAASPERIADWLVRQGMPDDEAKLVARQAFDRAQVRAKQAAAAQRGDQTMAILEIIAGIGLLIAGLAAGWFVGLFVFIIIDGFRRLGSA